MSRILLLLLLLACSPEAPPEPATELEQAIEQVRAGYGLPAASTFFCTLYLRKEEGVAWLIASNASTPDDTEYGRELLVAVRDASRAASGG